MGRLIDTSDLHNKVMLNKSDWGIFATQIDNLIEGVVMQVSTVEAIPKADYENRLKADMVAMLTDIQLEIEELDLKDSVPDYQKGADETREYITDLLQQKIDALKKEQEAADGKD